MSLQLRQACQRVLVLTLPFPIEVESVNTYLTGSNAIKLPVVADMNNLRRLDS